MANITLTNATNSPIRIDETHFGVRVPTSADLVGTDLQIAEIYRDAGAGTIVANSAPANTVLPAITGTARVGQVLTSTTGTWTGTPAPTYARQWKRNGANIAGATGATYTLVTADAGTVITVTVTATNSVGNAAATSAGTAAVTQTPANTVAPAVTGTATVGQTLTTTNGTWTGTPTPTYTRAWQRSANGTTGWAAIAGATALTYVLAVADDAQFVRCVVTGTNSAGNAVANSNVVGPVAAA